MGTCACILEPDLDFAIEIPFIGSMCISYMPSLENDPQAGRVIPAGYCGTVAPVMFTDENIDVGGVPLDSRIHDAVVDVHGPVTWGRSSYALDIEHDGRPAKLAFLWAWDEQRRLVAIAAPAGPVAP
jgi:hypothetical protein